MEKLFSRVKEMELFIPEYQTVQFHLLKTFWSEQVLLMDSYGQQELTMVALLLSTIEWIEELKEDLTQ